MARHSFFVGPGAIQGNRAEVEGQSAHQIRAVLRLRSGDVVDLLDNSGWANSVRLTEVERDRVAGEVVGRHRPETEPSVDVELYQALLKGQKMELVLQKGTEIGISRFVPVLSERCVSRPEAKEMGRKLERWEAIVREAAEQSGRALLPEVGRLEPFQRACRLAAEADLALMAWEEESTGGIGASLRDAGLLPSGGAAGGRELMAGRRRVALLIGPEGGFSADEAALARGMGLRVVTLGRRILRAETAALVAATLVLCKTGDMGG